ncbi:MAG TPA: hypothetical protein VGY54_25375, partial [Polyangiaceae bacterium]|nr:hypothetical protein [Polyangiaceae bacterium]
MLACAAGNFLALEFGCKIAHAYHELRGGVGKRYLFVVDVIKEPATRVDQVLDQEGRARAIATKAGFVAADNHVKRVRFGGVDHRDQSWALLELRAGDGVLAVDVLRGDSPSPAFNVSCRFLDLHCKARGLVLIGGPADVDGSLHDSGLRLVSGRVEDCEYQIGQCAGDGSGIADRQADHPVLHG